MSGGIPHVREVNGELVLDDPLGLAVGRAVAKHNCRLTLDAQAERVQHFKRRASELGRSPQEVVIILANVDDAGGAMLANELMPGYDWQQFRERGEVPFARGLAERRGVQSWLDLCAPETGAKLRDMAELAVVVVDYGTAEIFAA